MDGICSDCSESDLSADSLECEDFSQVNKKMQNKIVEKAKPDFSNNNNPTVPFYKGDVLVQDIIEKRNLRKSENTKHLNCNKAGNIPKQISGNNILSDSNLFPNSYSLCDFKNRSLSARVENKQRSSRRGTYPDSHLNNSDLVKVRHRSVSYLEQFRKKSYEINGLNSSIYSTRSSEISDNNETLSHMSSVNSGSWMGTTEVDFYENLIKTSERNKNTIKKTLYDEKIPPTKSREVQSKGRSRVLPIQKVNKEVNERKEIDKKSVLEKRETYAKKVKIRNRIKINRQKEKEISDKCKDSERYITREECLQNPYEETREFHNYNLVPVPFTLSVEELTPKLKCKTCKGQPTQRINKTELKKKRIKKHEDVSELNSLQQRHEKEKGLVESIRGLVLKKITT